MIKESLADTKRITGRGRSGLIENSGPKPQERIQRKQSPRSDNGTVEVLREGQTCPFCQFTELKREGDQISCPVCGYGHKPCT